MRTPLLLLLLLLPLSLWAQRPAEIPDNRVVLTDFGGVPDGVTLNTEAFRKAISALSKRGGGQLVVPEGLWLTGPIVLKDAIDLHLEKSAVIVFTPDKSAYVEEGSGRPCISASKRHDVRISGEGIIDGNGEWWRPVKRSKNSDEEWKQYLRKGGSVTQDGSLWYPFNLKHFPNVTAGEKSEEKLRARCRDVIIEGVTVRCPWNAQNGDGIDIMSCRHVRISGCTVDVGDDGICLKAGAGQRGVEAGPCQDILIENNTVFHAHGGFVIGSEFSGGMEDITVRHNVFSGTDTGLRFKSAPERGGVCRNIRISDIVMTDIKNEAVVFQTTYADRPAGYEDNQAARTERFLPDFTDIVMERIVCRGAATAIRSQGPLSQIHGIVLRDATFFYNETEQAVDDPLSIQMENVRFLTF